MQRNASTACLTALMLCLAGCETMTWPLPFKAKPKATTRPAISDKDRIKKLRLQIETLRADNETLASKAQSLEFRERLLSARLRKLQFANDSQASQIRALAKAPVDRDRYKMTVDMLGLTVHKLRKENAGLRHRLAELGRPTTKPAKAPTTMPSPTSRRAAGKGSPRPMPPKANP